MNNKNKFALILGDGGIKAAFVAGAGNELLHKYPEINNNLKIITGASAGAGNVIYYLSDGLDNPGHEMWTHALSDKNFIKFEKLIDLYKNKPVYDIDYLVDNIFKKHFPLNQEKIKNSKVNFYLPVQRADSNEIVYFSNKENTKRIGKGRVIKNIGNIDCYELVRAIDALPFLYDKEILLDKHRYVDAATLEPFPIDLPGMDDCKKIFIFSKKRPGFKEKFLSISFFCVFILLVYPFRKRKLRFSKYFQLVTKPFTEVNLFDKVIKMEREGSALIITSEDIKEKDLFNNSENFLERIYKEGIDIIDKNEGRIKEFIRK